jgi:hypothetical protein
MKKIIGFALVALLLAVVADAATSPTAEIIHAGTTDFAQFDVTGDETLLNSVLPAVRPRIRLSNANRLLQLTLSYPGEMIGDTTAPVVADLQVETLNPNTAIVSWTTQEFATSITRFGTVAGTYPDQVGDPLYVKSHQLQVAGLAADTVYYFVAAGEDLSGNAYESEPVSVRTPSHYFLHLPAIRR